MYGFNTTASQLQFTREHVTWAKDHCVHVLFTDYSRFSYSHVVAGNGQVSNDNGKKRRRPGKIYSACAISDGMAYNGQPLQKEF